MKLTEENYVGIAEQAIKELGSEKDQKGRLVGPVTTSKIRNLLAMTSDIYNDVVNSQSDKLNAEIIGRINYMKIRRDQRQQRPVYFIQPVYGSLGCI